MWHVLHSGSNRSGWCTLRSHTNAALNPRCVLSTYQCPTSWVPWVEEWPCSVKIFWRYTSIDGTSTSSQRQMCFVLVKAGQLAPQMPTGHCDGVHILKAKSSWRIKCLAAAQSRQYSSEVRCTRKHRFWCDAKVHCHIKPLQWDGASCLGFLVTQRQCWQRLWGFPSLNVTFSSACLLQYLSAELTAHYCMWLCAWRQNVPSVLSFPYLFWTPLLSCETPVRQIMVVFITWGFSIKRCNK